MLKMRYIVGLALLFTLSSVFVNFGQMHWPYGENVTIDSYDNAIYSQKTNPSYVTYRSGTPLTVSSIPMSELTGDDSYYKYGPRSIFDSLLAGNWNLLNLFLNFLFWSGFLFLAAYALHRLKDKGPWLIPTLALILMSMLFFYSSQIADDYLKLAAPFTIYSKGSFYPLGLLGSYLIFVPVSALILWIWRKFSTQPTFRANGKTYGFLGISLLVGIAAYLVTAAIVNGPNGYVPSFDRWIYYNLTANPNTLFANIAYPIYSISHYLLFFIPATATVALWRSGNKRLALIPLPAINIVYFTIPLMKLIYMHPRPPDPVVYLGETAFPGGLATLTVVFPVLALMLYREKNRFWYLATGILFSIFICYAWVVVRVHWVGDFVGGYALGIAIFALWSIIVFLIPWKSSRVDQSSNDNIKSHHNNKAKEKEKGNKTLSP